MKKVKFIHPITGESHEVMCDKVEEYGSVNDSYWWCLIGDKIIAQIPQSYAMIRIDESI
jgi:hypothetical protein